jgi:hypothetical protein
MRLPAALGTAFTVAVLSFSRGGSASVEADSGYTKVQTYSAALRYLRVDLAYEVTEKDPDAAYLLFRFVPEGRKAATNGSIEIVEREDRVRVFVRLPEMPRYREEVMSDGLQRKLREEYGDPPRREPPPEKKPDKDKDEDKDKGDERPAKPDHGSDEPG